MRNLTCTMALWALGCAAEPGPSGGLIATAELGPGLRGATVELGGETLELELADRNQNGVYGEPLIDDCSAIERTHRQLTSCEGVLAHRSGSYRVFVAPSGSSVRIERQWAQLRVALAAPPEGSIELLSGRIEAERAGAAFGRALEPGAWVVLGAGEAYRLTVVAAVQQAGVTYTAPITLSDRRVESGSTILTLLRRIGTHPLVETQPGSEGQPTIVPVEARVGAATALRFVVAGDEGEVLGCLSKAGAPVLPSIEAQPGAESGCERGIYAISYRPSPAEVGQDRTVLVSLENPFDPARPLEARFLVRVLN